MGFRYLDSVDTVRSRWGSAFPHLAKSEMILALLLGETVRISQTQAIDSLQILDFAEDPSFRELIREGFIEILPFVLRAEDTPRSPLGAFIDRLANPSFHFSSWQGIPTPPKTKETSQSQEYKRRLEILEDAKKGRFHDSEQERMWTNLDRLDAAYNDRTARVRSAGGACPIAGPAAFTLRSRLEACCRNAHHLPYLQESLAWLLSVVNGNDRSSYHGNINLSDIDSAVKLSLHSVVNLAYNEVIAGSLQADAALTTLHHDAEEVIRSAGMQSASVSAIEASDARLTRLHPVSWSSVLKWLRVIRRAAPESRAERIVEAAEDIGMQIAADDSKKNLIFRLVPASAGAGVHQAGEAIGEYLLSITLPGGALIARPVMKIVSTVASSFGAEKVEKRLEETLLSHVAGGEIRNIHGLLTRGFLDLEGQAR
ncbi:MAG TPA: hypothetical protein VGL22_04350 [Terracidiphilus sp.]